MASYPKNPPKQPEIDAAARIEIKASLIPGAGQGAFARVPLAAGEYLGQYRGEKLTHAQYIARYPQDRGGHYVMAIMSHFVDASNPALSSWTRYVNASDSPYNPLEANCEFRKGGKLHATRDIGPGEELLTAYGPEYDWAPTTFDQFILEQSNQAQFEEWLAGQ